MGMSALECEGLRAGKVSPLYPTKRTSMKGVATSLMGQERKLRLSLSCRTVAVEVIRAARLAATLPRIERDLRRADRGRARF